MEQRDIEGIQFVPNVRDYGKVALIGKETAENKVLNTAIESLCKKSDYLIQDRGHDAFNV